MPKQTTNAAVKKAGNLPPSDQAQKAMGAGPLNKKAPMRYHAAAGRFKKQHPADLPPSPNMDAMRGVIGKAPVTDRPSIVKNGSVASLLGAAAGHFRSKAAGTNPLSWGGPGSWLGSMAGKKIWNPNLPPTSSSHKFQGLVNNNRGEFTKALAQAGGKL